MVVFIVKKEGKHHGERPRIWRRALETVMLLCCCGANVPELDSTSVLHRAVNSPLPLRCPCFKCIHSETINNEKKLLRDIFFEQDPVTKNWHPRKALFETGSKTVVITDEQTVNAIVGALRLLTAKDKATNT